MSVLAVLPAAAAPEDFNAMAGYGTFMDSSLNRGHEVVVDSVTLASETTEPDSRIRLSFHATLKNTGGGYHDDVMFGLLPAADGWPVEIVTGVSALPDLPPNDATPVSTVTPVSLLCAAADKEAVKAAVLAKQRVHVLSLELFQMAFPPKAVDQATDEACIGLESNVGVAQLDFEVSTPYLNDLVAGDLMMENLAVHRIHRPPSTDALLYMQVRSAEGDDLDGQIHETFVVQVVSKAPLSGGGTRIIGQRLSLNTVLKAGTFLLDQMDAFDDPVRDPFNPPIGSAFFSGLEMERRLERLGNSPPRSGERADTLGLFCLHYPFNGVQFGKYITLDGEVLLRGLNIGLELRIRNFELRRVATQLTSQIEVDARVTADAGAENSGDPIFEKEKTLVSAPLGTITIPAGNVPITITPIFTVKVGASVSVPTRIVLPLHSSAEGGFYMGWDKDKPVGERSFFEPIHEIVPLKVSTPGIAEALTASASVWAEGGILLDVNGSSGPSIGIRATGEMSVSPLADPWWTISGSTDFTAGFAFSALGFDIIDVHGPIVSGPDLFNISSSSGPLSGSGPLHQAAGDHIRWARAIQWGAGAPSTASVCKVTGTPEDLFTCMRSFGGKSIISRINALGEPVWSKGDFFFVPEEIASTPDGGLMVLGGSGSGSYFLNRYDGNGNLVWARDRRITDSGGNNESIALIKVLARQVSPGNEEIFVIGKTIHLNDVLNTDLMILKYDGAGTLLWAKAYPTADGEHPADAIFSHDGSLLVCGDHNKSPDGINPPNAGALTGGLVMRLASGDGAVIWTKRTETGLGTFWRGIAESPDGTIYTCGTRGQTILVESPVIHVAAYSSNGEVERMVTVGELPATAQYDSARQADPRVPNTAVVHANPDENDPSQTGTGLRDWLPDAGMTPWDFGVGLAWTEGGLVVAANTGLNNGSRAPLSFCLNEQFSIRWLTTHDLAQSDETLLDMAVTDDGIALIGASGQFAGTGSGNPSGSPANWGAVLFKLGFDGKVQLHPAVGGTDRFLQPVIHDGMYDEGDVNIPSPQSDFIGVFPLTLTAANQPNDTGNPGATVSDVPFTNWVPLEQGNDPVPMTYPEWAAYHHLPPASDNPSQDADGDGRSNGAEYYFGGSPDETDPSSVAPVFSKDGNEIVLHFPRSKSAAGLAPVLQTSTQLANDWLSVPPSSTATTGSSAGVDLMEMRLLFPTDPKRFYRIATPPLAEP